MKHIKALFFDVDNTLYTHRIHDFPATTRQTLNRLKENGYRIGIATSRCRYEVRNLPAFFRDFAFDAAIFDGGALIMAKRRLSPAFPCYRSRWSGSSATVNKGTYLCGTPPLTMTV